MKCKQYLKPTSTQAQTFSIFNEFEHLNIRNFRFVWVNTFSRVNAFVFSISEEIIRCNENRPHTKFQLKLFEWNRQPSDSCMPTNFNHFHHFSPTKTFLIRNIYTVQRYIHEDEQVMKVGCSLWFFFQGKTHVNLMHIVCDSQQLIQIFYYLAPLSFVGSIIW